MPTTQEILKAYDAKRQIDTNQGDLVNLESNVVPQAELYTGQDLDYISQYDIGTPYSEAVMPGGFEKRRHEMQPWYASLGNAVNQAVVGEIAGGTLEGLGYLGDLPQYAELAKGTEKDFGNWLSDIGKDLKSWTQEATPVYTDPNKEGQFSPEDWTWWMSNLPSVASTLSLMIPAAGAVKGASLLGKAMGMSAKLGKTAKWAATGLGQAIVSRHMENLMEASGTADELKQLSGTKLDENQYKTFQKNYGIELIPENVGGKLYYTLDENSATEIAAKAASNIYKANWAMLAQDIPQYLLLNTPFGKATEKLTAGMAKKLGQSSIPVITEKLAAVGSDMISEGAEEGYQYIVGERAKELALADAGMIDRRDFSSSLKDYAGRGEFWTSAFFGALGSGFMQTAGKPLNKMINRIKGIESSDERRMKDLDVWKDRVNQFNNSLLVAEKFNKPDMFESTKDDLTTAMAVQAAQNGNLDYMIQTIDAIANSEDADQQILGITKESVEIAKENNPTLIRDLKRVGELYQKNLDKHGKEFAGTLTEYERGIEILDTKIVDIESKSNKVLNNVPNIDGLSATGRSILEASVELSGYKNIKKQLEKLHKSSKDVDLKEKLANRITGVNNKIEELTNVNIKTLEESYSSEDKAKDSKIEVGSTEFDEYSTLATNTLIKKEEKSSRKIDLDELRTYKGQEKFLAKRDKIAKEELHNVVNNATTPEEMEVVADAVTGTKYEKDVKDIISDKASIEDKNAAETTEFLKMQSEQAFATTEVNEQNEEAITEGVKEDIKNSPLATRYKDDERKTLSSVYFKDHQAIQDILDNLAENATDAKEEMGLMGLAAQYKRNVKLNDPQTLLTFIEKLMINAKVHDNTNAVKIINAISEYFAKIQESKAVIKAQVKNNVKEAETNVSTTDDYVPTIEEPSSSSDGKGNRWIRTAPNNAPVISKTRNIAGENVSLLQKDELADEFLLDLKVPIGATVHIEINEFDQGHNPKEDISKFTAQNRRYRIVYYVDGNSKNKWKENRKVLGLLPMANDNMSTPEGVSAISILREELFKQFPPQLDKDSNDKNGKLSTGITTTIGGTKMTYDRSNNPYIDVSTAIAPIIKKAVAAKQFNTDQVKKLNDAGGFYLGYVNNHGTLLFPHSNIPSVNKFAPQTLNGDDSSTSSSSGEIVVAIPNPAIPSQYILLRVFKKPIRELRKTMPSVVEQLMQESLEIIEKDLQAQNTISKMPSLGITSIAMNKLLENLAFPANSKRFISQMVKLEDLQDKSSEGYKKLQDALNDAWMNFDKQYLNATNYTSTLDNVITSGPFNEVMNRYLSINILPGKPFSDVQALISTDFKSPATKAATKLARKVVKEVVNKKKENLQPEIIKGGIEVSEIEARKADILKREKKEINELANNLHPNEEHARQLLSITHPDKIRKINAKYDAELVALENKESYGGLPVKQDKIPSKEVKRKPLKRATGTRMVSSSSSIKKDLILKKESGEIDSEDKEITRLKVVEKGSKEKVKSTKEEAEWIKNKLPHVSIADISEIQDILHESVKSGYEALGAMYNAAIYVQNEPYSGVLFHEAFHVLFNYGLSEKDVVELTKNIPGDSIIEKEEYLADQFADYMIADVADKSILGRLRKFFRQLKTLIRAFAGANVTSVVELADRADLGFYKKSIRTYKFNNSTLRLKVENWSFEKTKEAVDSISKHIMMDLIPSQRENNEELSLKSDAEILQLFTGEDNPYEIFEQTYNDFIDALEDLVKSDPDNPKIELLYDLVTNMFDENLTPGVLIHETIKAFGYNNGIDIKIDTLTEEEFKENWQVEFQQRSAKDNAPVRIKNFIRYMKSGETNSFGLPKYVEYDDTYNTLLKDLAGSKRVSQIIKSLNNSLLFHPEYQQLLDAMKDSSFATDMLQAFSRDLASFTVIVGKGGKYIVTDSNRKGVVNSIVTDWTNTVLQKDPILMEDATLLKEEFDTLYKTIKSSKEVDNSIYNRLSEITKEFGFEIESKVFEYVQTLNPKYRNNFYVGQFSINTILNSFIQGNNPFNIETVDNVEDIKNELNSIKAIANVVKQAKPDLYESSFFDVEGNRVYAHNVPTFLSSFMNTVTDVDQIEGYIQEHVKDDFFSAGNGRTSNFILKKLENAKNDANELKDALQVSYVDGLNESGNKLGYPDMTYADLQAFTLAGYFNNGNNKHSMFRMPVFSDAGRMALVRVERPKNNKESLLELLSLAEKEFNRITLLEKNGGNGIKGYDSDINKSFATGFHIMHMLNGKIDKSPTLNSKKSLELIEKYFDNLADNYYKKLIANKVLVLEGKGFNIKESRIDNRILANRTQETFKDFVKEFIINDFLIRSSMSLLTIGDPAFYGYKGGSVTVDYIKRAKEIMSPKLIPDTTAQYTEYKEDGTVVENIKVSATYNTIYLQDAQIGAPSNEAIVSTITKLHEDGIISADKLKQLKVAYSAELDKNGKGVIEQSDGQAYITLPFYRETMISFGRWTPKHQSAYKRMIKGNGTANDIALMLQPIKPFMFTQVYNTDLKRFVPVQHKNSEYVLLPQLVKNNPKLAKLYDYMTTNNVGIANFNSAVKVGGFGSVNLDDISNEVQPTIHEIPTIDRGIQQESPDHIIDSENLFGTQIRKLIMSDLNEGTTYFGDKTADELYQLYEDLIVQDLKEAYSDIESKFIDESGEVNYTKLHQLLLDESDKRGKGEEFEKAISLKIDRNGKERTTLPLFHPLFSNTTESLITSIFRNNVTKQKIKGAAVVQVSNFGLSRELKLVFDEGINEESVEVKEGVSDIFKENPELSDAGTQEQYSEYLDSIFPESKVRGIQYHKRQSRYQDPSQFRTRDGAYYFGTNEQADLVEDMAGGAFEHYSVLLNMEKPQEITFAERNISENKKYSDGIIINVSKEEAKELVGDRDYYDLSKLSTEYAVFNPEQIHILGSKKDIEGFKEFIENQPKKEVRGLQYAEVMLPAWSKEFFKDFVDKDGNVDFDLAKEKLPEEVFEMIGYRIPTEDKYSMLPMKIVGFLPLESGGSIMLPAEITTISGSDFDIDKLYVMMKSFTRNSDGTYTVDKYDESKGVEGNSKAARDNMKMDLMTSVLRNPYTLEAILTPGGYEYNRDIAHAVAKKLRIMSNLPSIFDINTMDKMAIRNMTGKKLIGIAANHNAHHALRQHFNLKLTSPVLFDGMLFDQLGSKKASTQFKITKDGIEQIDTDKIDRNISRNLSEFLAAVVDNAKDPLAVFMNYNTITADTISLLVSLGVDTHTAIFFMNQPIILEVIKKQTENPNKYIGSIIKEVAKKYSVELKQETPTFLTKDLYNSLGISHIDNQQKDVLVAYAKYQKMAKDLGDVIRASSADTKGLGASISHGEVILKLQDKILNSDTFSITGVEDLFNETDKHNFVSAFTKQGISEPIKNVLNKVYPYNNTVFDDIKNYINDQITIRNLSPEERNFINRTVVTYLMSGFDFFGVEERGDILYNIPSRLIEMRNKYPELTKNPLISRLNFENKSDRVAMDVISFNNVGKLSDGQRVRIQQSWSDMLNPAKNTNDDLREFAEDLIKYSYYTSGLNFTPNSFSHLIPVDAYISLVKDSKGMSLSNLLYQELDVYADINSDFSNIEELTQTFLDQFYRNNYSNPTYVPRLNEDKSNYTIKTESRITVNPETVTDESLFTKSGEDYTGKMFIVEKDGFNFKLYKFAGYNINSGVLTYDRVTKLGLPNYVVEYDRNGGIFMESALENNMNTISKVSVNLNNKQADIDKLDDVISNSYPTVSNIPTKEDLDQFDKICPGDIKLGNI